MSTLVAISWAEAAVLLVLLVLLVARHHRSARPKAEEAPTIDAPPPAPLGRMSVRTYAVVMKPAPKPDLEGKR